MWQRILFSINKASTYTRYRTRQLKNFTAHFPFLSCLFYSAKHVLRSYEHSILNTTLNWHQVNQNCLLTHWKRLEYYIRFGLLAISEVRWVDLFKLFKFIDIYQQ